MLLLLLLLLVLLLPVCIPQAGTWYMDRKNEVPAGKENYYVLPIVNWHQVGTEAYARPNHTAVAKQHAACMDGPFLRDGRQQLCDACIRHA